MELSTPVIIGIVLLVLILLIILVLVGVMASRKRKAQQQEADRRRAAQMREEASQKEQVVQERDLKARETELEAERARLDAQRRAKEVEQEKIAAERRHAEAAKQREQVDQERSTVQEQLAEADRLDPDSGDAHRADRDSRATRGHDHRPGHGDGGHTPVVDDRHADGSAGRDRRAPGAPVHEQPDAARHDALHADDGARPLDQEPAPHDRSGADHVRVEETQTFGEHEGAAPSHGRRAARPSDQEPRDPQQPQDLPGEQDPFLAQEQQLAQEDGELPPRAPEYGRREDGTGTEPIVEPGTEPGPEHRG